MSKYISYPSKNIFKKNESKLLNISLLSLIEVEPDTHQPNILEYLQKNSPQVQQKSLTSVGKTPLV
ncbi:hypothetical protein EXW43_29025 (plasmid) [Bacillus mycoides]|nr:hypothetical protein EXW43_29025 [Bacillus mycoides]